MYDLYEFIICLCQLFLEKINFILVDVMVCLQPGMYVTLHIANVPPATIGKFTLFRSLLIWLMGLSFLSKTCLGLIACSVDRKHIFIKTRVHSDFVYFCGNTWNFLLT